MATESSLALQQLGCYDLLGKIAEGGMGAVYKGRHRDSGLLVAIKVIPADTTRSPLSLRRFEQEFKAASLIDHPNVVKALDYCGTGPTPFLVMEFVEGETLGQRVERDGPLSESEAVWIIGQVCEGLHRAHKQGLIHRDVKPDNIMTGPDGVVKLTDLGLVKDVEGEQNLTRTGRGLGTPHFMAPEQFRMAKNADVRCDVYSLGATLYMLVTGAVPFARTTPLDCWMKKVRNDLPEARSFTPDLSPRVNWAIGRAMNAKPEQRPASCREFMEDVTGVAWRANSGSSASPVAGVIRKPPTDDLWYLVYRDAAGEPHTVKGTTDGVRRNVVAGSLGDSGSIVVSRTKTGHFSPLKSVPEFRDLVVPGTTPPPAAGLTATPRLTAADESPTPSSGASAQTVEDITEFERPALDLPGRPEAPRQYAVDTPPPAPVSWVTWLLLAATAAVVAAGGIGLALLLK
ncbi:MAG TPA: serine/threonine-protein kinase [Fimbriiglobus sp.]|nr:serine/threonine-protein kinase [Fimbriiglobus sp.]